MRAGGDLIVSPVHGTHTVDINHAARDVREKLRGVETPEGLLCDEQEWAGMMELERHGVRTEKRRRRVVEFLTTVGVVVLAVAVWLGIVALLR